MKRDLDFSKELKAFLYIFMFCCAAGLVLGSLGVFDDPIPETEPERVEIVTRSQSRFSEKIICFKPDCYHVAVKVERLEEDGRYYEWTEYRGYAVKSNIDSVRAELKVKAYKEIAFIKSCMKIKKTDYENFPEEKEEAETVDVLKVSTKLGDYELTEDNKGYLMLRKIGSSLEAPRSYSHCINITPEAANVIKLV